MILKDVVKTKHIEKYITKVINMKKRKNKKVSFFERHAELIYWVLIISVMFIIFSLGFYSGHMVAKMPICLNCS